MDMVNELLGIQYNIAKANRTDRKKGSKSCVIYQ